jgi:hypothetical protein
MSSDNKFSRRNLVKGMSAVCGLSLIKDQMMDQIVSSFMSSAEAATGELQNFRYINFCTNGGIPRWYFDLPLAPNGVDTIIPNKQVITKIKTEIDSSINGVYAHTKVGNFYLPLLWSYNIPLSTGSTGNLKQLASHALFIRGVDQGLDGHEFNILKQNSPTQGGLTYSGIFADSGSNPIPAANAGINFEHRSAQNKAILPFSYRDDFKVLSTSFNSFKTADPKSFNRRDMAQRTIEAAVKSIQKTQGANSPYLSAVKSNRDSAIELLMSNFDTIDADYTAIYNKYQNLITQALLMALPGVTSEAIIAKDKDVRFNVLTQENRSGVQASPSTGDIRLGFQNILPNQNFAHSFALAEFLITKNLSSSVVCNLGFWSNFDIKNYYSFNQATQKYDDLETSTLFNKLTSDAHDTGAFPALLMFTRHYHCYATCLHELVTVLKSKNLFESTLIHTTTDFNRIPRVNGSGADHGFSGSSTSLITGRITQPIVVGNIAQNGLGRGTWGEAANNTSLGERKINLGNVASTICSIFELPTPAINDSSLVTLGTDKKVILPTAKPANIA